VRILLNLGALRQIVDQRSGVGDLEAGGADIGLTTGLTKAARIPGHHRVAALQQRLQDAGGFHRARAAPTVGLEHDRRARLLRGTGRQHQRRDNRSPVGRLNDDGVLDGGFGRNLGSAGRLGCSARYGGCEQRGDQRAGKGGSEQRLHLIRVSR
jgi:hypothetical protein